MLIPNRYPAYIPWEEYARNQDQLQENRSTRKSKGAPRRGEALLPGLAFCQCGRRFRVAYRSHQTPFYVCESHLAKGEEQQTCWGMTAKELDDLVAQQVLLALQPASLELTMRAARDTQRERERLHAHWRQRLERSAQQVERAERQYQLVEPENRLVARTLEKHWEAALRSDRELQEDYARFVATIPRELSEEDLERLRSIAHDIRGLWDSAETTHGDRKEMVRCLVDRVLAHVRCDSEYVEVVIHWHGGFTSRHEIARPVFDAAQQRDYDRLVARIRELHSQGLTCSEMAARLNEEGFVPARRKKGYSKASLAPMLKKLGILRSPQGLQPEEWWACELARELGVTSQKIYHWARQGYVHARRTPQRHWIVWADQDELQRLHALKRETTSWIQKRAPELTIPKDRPPSN